MNRSRDRMLDFLLPMYIALLGALAITGCAQTSDSPVSDSPAAEETASDSLPTNDDSSDSQWRIHGRVHRAGSSTVGTVDIATNWSANGQQWNNDATFPDIQSPEAITEYWNDEGEMEPRPKSQAATAANGVFEILVSKNKTSPKVVLALNERRTLGGLAVAWPEDHSPLTIHLSPLVHLHGEIRCDGKVPEWSFACLFPAHLKNAPD